MGHWLCAERRHQAAGTISRFDPRFWTVNFPRPMMAAVTTTAPDALRVDCAFYRQDDLAGLTAGCRSAGDRAGCVRWMRSTARC